MNASFYINDYLPAESANLLLKVGEANLEFTILQNKKFTALAKYYFSSTIDIETILNTEPLLQNSFSKVDVIFTNKECVLVPPTFYNTSNLNHHLALLYGPSIDVEIKSDFLYRHNIHTIYQVKKEIINYILAKFPYSNSHHIYSLLPDVAGLIGTKLHVIFYEKKCIVLCCKQNNLQLIQQFEYTTPEDVSYYLLAIAQQHQLLPSDLHVEVGGTIDHSSNLYTELHKYFKHINFGNLNTNFAYCTEIENIPSHYFLPLLNVASCV